MYQKAYQCVGLEAKRNRACSLESGHKKGNPFLKFRVYRERLPRDVDLVESAFRILECWTVVLGSAPHLAMFLSSCLHALCAHL